MKIFYEILTKERLSLLPAFADFKEKFYLAGGTGLALQIGHRISEDFDFFTQRAFDNDKMLKKLSLVFPSYSLSVIQNEKDTLTILLNNEIKISFFKLDYENLFPLIETKEMRIASVQEIGIMKIIALLRATYKDYVDIYYILQDYDIDVLIKGAKEKHPNFEDSIYLKSLLSYEDVDISPITYLSGKEVKQNLVFNFIKDKTVNYIKNIAGK